MSSLRDEEEVRGAVLTIINEIPDPCSVAARTPAGLFDMGLVVDLEMTPRADKYDVGLSMRVTSPGCMFFSVFDSELRERISALEDVRSVEVSWSMDPLWDPSMMSDELRARRGEQLVVLEQGARSRLRRDKV